MNPDAIRRAVLDAIARGDIPAGGPSELAARDLVDDAPARYWQRWADDAAARIRERARRYPPLPAEPSADELGPEPTRRRRSRRTASADAQVAYAPHCQRCGRKRRYGETFGGSYRHEGTRIATCSTCHFGLPTPAARREPLEQRGDSERLAEIVDVIRSSLLAWRRVAPGEFCSWRPIRNGLGRFGLDDLELIDEACRLLGVERRRCGTGERWRLRHG